MSLTESQRDILDTLYTRKGYMLGRDNLWYAARRFHPEAKITQMGVMSFLRTQETWQIHTRNMMKPGSVAPLLRTSPGYCQVDLKFLPKEKGYIGLLVLVDLFTKYAMAKPIRNKTDREVARAMGFMLNDARALPKKISVIQSDNGGEFKGSFSLLLQRNGIKQIYSRASTPQSNSQVERMNGYISSIVHKAISRGYRWSDNLDEYLKVINTTPNASTKMAPIDLELASAEVKQQVAERMTGVVNKRYGSKTKDSVLQVGQQVRLLKPKGALTKISAEGVWSNEMYRINKIVLSKYPNILSNYKVQDQSGKVLKGLYPRYQILAVETPVPN